MAEVSMFVDTAQSSDVVASPRRLARPKTIPIRVPNYPVEVIVARVAVELGVTAEDVFSRAKSKTIARARAAAMREARAKYGFSYPELGRFFGRDHTSVMYALKGKKSRARKAGG